MNRGGRTARPGRRVPRRRNPAAGERASSSAACSSRAAKCASASRSSRSTPPRSGPTRAAPRAAVQRAQATLARARIQEQRLAPARESRRDQRPEFMTMPSPRVIRRPPISPQAAPILRAVRSISASRRSARRSAGRIDQAVFTEGALASATSEQPLATVQQIDRVYVDVRQPASRSEMLREAAGAGAANQGALVDDRLKRRAAPIR